MYFYNLITNSNLWSGCFLININMNNKWKTFSMSELYDLLNESLSTIFIKPSFPTRRWGNIYLREATTDKEAIEKGIIMLRDKGVVCRKRICKESTQKHKKSGKFYKIEIYNKNNN